LSDKKIEKAGERERRKETEAVRKRAESSALYIGIFIIYFSMAVAIEQNCC